MTAAAPRPELTPRRVRAVTCLTGPEIRSLFEGGAWLSSTWLNEIPLSRMALDTLAPGWHDPHATRPPDDLASLSRQLPGDAPLTKQMEQFLYLHPSPRGRDIALPDLPWALLLLHLERRAQATQAQSTDLSAALDDLKRFGATIWELYETEPDAWFSSLQITAPASLIIKYQLNRLTVENLTSILTRPGPEDDQTILLALQRKNLRGYGLGLYWLVSLTPTIARPPHPAAPWCRAARRHWGLAALRSSGLLQLLAERTRTGDEPRHAADLLNDQRHLSDLCTPASDPDRHDPLNWTAHLIMLLALPAPLRAEVLGHSSARDLRGTRRAAQLLRGQLTADLSDLHPLLEDVAGELEQGERAAVQNEKYGPPGRISLLSRLLWWAYR